MYRRTARTDQTGIQLPDDKKQHENGLWKPDLSHKQIIRKVLGWVDYRRRARADLRQEMEPGRLLIRRWPKLSLTKRLMDF